MAVMVPQAPPAKPPPDRQIVESLRINLPQKLMEKADPRRLAANQSQPKTRLIVFVHDMLTAMKMRDTSCTAAIARSRVCTI